jgi:hypothetical protein
MSFSVRISEPKPIPLVLRSNLECRYSLSRIDLHLCADLVAASQESHAAGEIDAAYGHLVLPCLASIFE